MRNERIYIRLTRSERAAIEAEALRDGRTLADVVRRCVRQVLS